MRVITSRVISEFSPLYIGCADYRDNNYFNGKQGYTFLIRIIFGITINFGELELKSSYYLLSRAEVIKLMQLGNKIEGLNYVSTEDVIVSNSLPILSITKLGLYAEASMDGLVPKSSFLLNKFRDMNSPELLQRCLKQIGTKERRDLFLSLGNVSKTQLNSANASVNKGISQFEAQSMAKEAKSNGDTVRTFGDNHGHNIYLISNKNQCNHKLIVPDDALCIPNIAVATHTWEDGELHGKLKVIGGGPNLVSLCYAFESQTLSSIDLSGLNTCAVVDMTYMFSCCHKLINLNLGKIDTSNVRHMDRMFTNCSSLVSVDLSNFNTVSLESMVCMFYDCVSLKKVNLHSFYTGNVKTMGYMFLGCKQLKSVDFSNFSFHSMKRNMLNGTHFIFDDTRAICGLLNKVEPNIIYNLSCYAS